MTNSEIIDKIELTAKLLDLHDKDEMRAKVYGAAAFNLDREIEPLANKSEKDLQKIRGVGKLLAENIVEICQTGQLKELEELISITPMGLFEVFKVKGLGVKKIKVLWKELGIDNIKQLKEACEKGIIAAQKGFGQKSQDAILESIAFISAQEGKLRMDKGMILSGLILEEIKKHYEKVYEVGQVIRKTEIVDLLQFIVIKDGFGGIKLPENDFQQDIKNSSPSVWRGFYKDFSIPVEIEKSSEKDFVIKNFIKNANEKHLKYQNESGISLLEHITNKKFENETELYLSFGSKYIVPEMREGLDEFEWIKTHNNDDLVAWKYIKGTVHNHSTYSDGKNTLKEMADYCQNLGLEYFGIADHSQTATYASGLWPDTVLKQHAEIEELNAANPSFRILKGIESDILPNGDLDYEEDILKRFEYVVASVHSVLNMDINKATERLIKAIENPYTTILGHLSGRLLLNRNGYPLDYKKIIDACAANKVIIEINASPYRLDIDWRYIPYCLEKGVMLSINPDAHKVEGILDMYYGIDVARKGGLTYKDTLNCQPLERVLEIFKKR